MRGINGSCCILGLEISGDVWRNEIWWRDRCKVWWVVVEVECVVKYKYRGYCWDECRVCKVKMIRWSLGVYGVNRILNE